MPTGRRVLSVALLFVVLALAWPTALRAQTIVQHAIKEATTSSLKLNLAFGSSTTAGDTIVATFALSSGTQTGTVTDSLGTTCYQGPHIAPSSAPVLDLEQWYCPNVAGGADTVTVTIGGAVQRAVTLEIVELSGVLTTSGVLDQSATHDQSTSSVTAITGTTPTTTSASEIAIGAVGFAAVKTLSTGPANGTSLDNQSTIIPSLFTADQIVTSTGTLSNSWTMTGSSASLGLIGTYVAAQSTATPTPTATATSQMATPTLTPTGTATVTATAATATATATTTLTTTATATATETPTTTATTTATSTSATTATATATATATSTATLTVTSTPTSTP